MPNFDWRWVQDWNQLKNDRVAFWDSLDQQQQQVFMDLSDKLNDWVDKLTLDQQEQS